MELSERNKLVIARVENFNYILRTAMFVLLGTLALGVFAEGNAHIWALSATIIGATLYGILAGNTSLNDMAALREDMDEETKIKFKKWKGNATRVYEENIRRKSQILQFMRTLNLAEKFKDFEQIYFPYQADFRGRKYTVSSFLTPQGTEPAKALLTFGDGLPIENEEQKNWLAIHGANCAGVDKVNFEERIKWIEENNYNILRSAQEGLDYDWWTQFDDAWLFFAFCLEWAGLKRDGLGYISHLPIALDGSNNGLQHYSAMLRCPIGGKATNLTI